MKNKLIDLNDYLFEQIERLNDEDLTEEELNLQIKKADKIANISKVIIQNQQLQLNAAKIAAEYGIVKPQQMKHLIGASEEKADRENA